MPLVRDAGTDGYVRLLAVQSKLEDKPINGDLVALQVLVNLEDCHRRDDWNRANRNV